VFGLLAKLAPVHFRVDQDAWSRSRRAGNSGARAINCAPLVPIRTMRGAADCHMCGRCEGFRDAIELAPRSPNHEIVHVAGAAPKPWETMLIVFGLMGVAGGAFQWSGSPWYVAIKQAAAEWLIDHGMMWPMRAQPPWWILTDYPGLNDQMTLLDGAIVLVYIAAAASITGAAVLMCLWAATRSLGAWSPRPFHHLAQSLIPIAACGVFLGLSATTVTLLRAEGFPLAHIGLLRGALLGGAALWSAALAWSIAGRYASERRRKLASASFVALASLIGAVSSVLIFFVW
jgi:polyferredoxin